VHQNRYCLRRRLCTGYSRLYTAITRSMKTPTLYRISTVGIHAIIWLVMVVIPLMILKMRPSRTRRSSLTVEAVSGKAGVWYNSPDTYGKGSPLRGSAVCSASTQLSPRTGRVSSDSHVLAQGAEIMLPVRLGRSVPSGRDILCSGKIFLMWVYFYLRPGQGSAGMCCAKC
jgi:hypothetical protein